MEQQQEEGKKIDPAQPEKLDDETVIWQWQLGPDPDPWAESDPTKWTWKNYSDDECDIIEKAFSLKKEAADLKGYEINFKRMHQVNKMDKNKFRRVRRREKSRHMMDLSETVIKEQKTMNEAFGTIQHFLDYIMKRTPEAYSLYQRLKKLSLDCKDSENTEFQDIIKEVVACIEKGGETRQRVAKTRTESQKKDFASEAKLVVSVILSNSATLEQFLKTILKVYTMETFVCYWMNELLRCADWEQINVLTPYLVCLVYTFKLDKYIMKYKEPQGILNTIFGFVAGKHKISLYRGAALSKNHLDIYDIQKVKYFSWNGISSTTREKNVALNFIEMSLNKAKKNGESKVGVFFKIESDFASPEDCEGMIDTLQHECSQFEEEKEVILAPGTVFELVQKRELKSNLYEITLKITKKFEEVKEKHVLLGAIQDQAILKDKAIIDGLPSDKSRRVLELLRGNKLIRKIEIRNSGVEESIMEEIESVRATTNVKREDIKLVNNVIAINNFSQLVHYFTAGSLNDICISNTVRFIKEAAVSKNTEIKEIKSLILNEKALERFHLKNQSKELWTKLKNESQLKKLDLSLNKMQTSNHEFKDFVECIGEMKSLESLRLMLNQNQTSGSRENIELLCKAIGSLSSLTGLSLDFTVSDEGLKFFENELAVLSFVKNISLCLNFCDKISDEGIKHLKNSLKSLSSLEKLSLNFVNCHEISDDGLGHLKNGLLELKSLRKLSICLDFCYKITDAGLDEIKSGLSVLTSLEHLSLNFSDCNLIEDKGLDHLEKSLKLLKSLQHLSLNFTNCKNISDEGVNYLKNAIISMTSLKHLSLDLKGCSRISDETLLSLKDCLIKLKSLRFLSLDFMSCSKISDKGLSHLKECLIGLTSLQNLSLDFYGCNKISDEGINYLNTGFSALKSLQHFTLNFWSCTKISDDGLSHLESSLMAIGSSLQSVSFDFTSCNKISDKGLACLEGGLRFLSSLKDLSLNFMNCCKVSDDGLKNLKGCFLTLNSIQKLSLNFMNCDKISDEGVNHLKSGLILLLSLQSLSLNFTDCTRVSDKGLENLKSAFVSLLTLQNLSLDFSRCNKISNAGLKDLRGGLTALVSLQCVLLNFSHCNKISDDGLNHLKKALISLTYLQQLSLHLESRDKKISNEVIDNFKTSFGPLSSLQVFIS